MLGKHHNLKNKTKFQSIWDGYIKYKADVRHNTPKELTLRDKDRYLWGKSFYEQLKYDVEYDFNKEFKYSTNQCPKCNSVDTIPIVYGMPGYELAIEAEEGVIKLGGCCIDKESPAWYCKKCKNKWR